MKNFRRIYTTAENEYRVTHRNGCIALRHHLSLCCLAVPQPQWIPATTLMACIHLANKAFWILVYKIFKFVTTLSKGGSNGEARRGLHFQHLEYFPTRSDWDKDFHKKFHSFNFVCTLFKLILRNKMLIVLNVDRSQGTECEIYFHNN